MRKVTITASNKPSSLVDVMRALRALSNAANELSDDEAAQFELLTGMSVETLDNAYRDLSEDLRN